jgi:MFS family permease
MSGLFGLPGWQWLFLMGGLPCLLLGGLVLVVLKDNVADAGWLSPAEKHHLQRRLAHQNRDIGEHSFLGTLKVPGFLLLGLIYFLIQIGSYGLNFWAPDLIRTAGGGNPTIIGFLTAVPYICGAISMVVVGRMSDKSGERRLYVAVLIAVAGLGFFAAGFFDKNVTLLVIALAVIGGGVVASIPAFWALPSKLLTGAGAAAGIALINTLGQLGGIVSPVMVGRIKDVTGSATSALYVIGGLCLLCALLLLVAMPERLRRSDRV